MSELNVNLRNTWTLYGEKTKHLQCLMYTVLGEYRNVVTCKSRLAPSSSRHSLCAWTVSNRFILSPL